MRNHQWAQQFLISTTAPTSVELQWPGKNRSDLRGKFVGIREKPAHISVSLSAFV